MNQKFLGLTFSIIFILIGLVAYFALSNQESMTALIPSFFGAPLLIISILKNETIKKWFNFIISGLLLAGTMPGFLKFFPLYFQGQEFARPMAIKVQAFTALFAFLFLVLTFFISLFKKDR